MYAALNRLIERLLRIPGPPTPPPGDEASTRLFRAAPNYFYYLLIVWLLRTAVVLVLVLPEEIAMFKDVIEKTERRFFFPPLVVVAGIIAVQRLFALAVIRLDFEKRWYLLTDRSLRVREGVMNIREMTITFANIQNISISQGPIQRLLGLSDLRVDTAGGGAQPAEKQDKENLHGVRFRGVNNAEEIRALINTRLRELKDSGLGDTDEAVVAPTGANKSLSAALVAPVREILSEATALRQTVANAR